jgi:LytS/YehU family sensor histidine kinase
VYWFRSEKEKLSIENKRLLAEIQLMKIKLHPHFLFNTLNNLYAMSKMNCENSSEYILKLAEIYRTMLYECNQEYYPLKEELCLIDNYIELEKLRYDNRLKLVFNLPNTINDNILIPPLLLFTFVENAFKHGCRHDVGNPFIQLEVNIDGDFILFKSENSVPAIQPEITKFGGIGLENTQKRLELIYGNEYVFQKQQTNDTYTVTLRIPKL